MNILAILRGGNYYFHFIDEDTESRGGDCIYFRPSNKCSQNLNQDLHNSKFALGHECQTKQVNFVL